MILVTGATGLVGAHLVMKLVREQKKVRALYRSETKKEQFKKLFDYYFEQDESLYNTIEWYQGDLTDIPSLTDAFDNITQVYHCAAKISFDPSHFKKLRKVNIEGTANIVNLCLIHSIKKLCYVSSIAALGENSTGEYIDETAEWNPEIPNSVYAISKYGAEMEVWRGIQEGLQAVIVNPGIIIGPGFFNSGSGILFKRINSGMKYYTTGTSGYIGVNDVVDIMYLLTTGNYSNQRYILTAKNMSYQSAFTQIAKALNKPVPSKKISPFTMNIAYELQRIGHFLFRTKRSIFKSSIRSAFTVSLYKNDKIKETLNYKFTPVEQAIKETATLLLKNF
ncbi:NAD-dependent epimerase/dehydratase family protein [Aquimarina sp. D1M17]|uniref:NAD-dependent epimerase/dehydratase family protein n=1 Tax=Aquimarina acroporae TaxID=2937283 RepID=UPI0020C0B4F5|nr:NAD-dependent epimerase/dehydratase family protein [Aquimarina acroporae]MCK8520887.1 NAD-dependent epimerase/dehydratase family protein [Aquimarina acroporae]